MLLQDMEAAPPTLKKIHKSSTGNYLSTDSLIKFHCRVGLNRASHKTELTKRYRTLLSSSSFSTHTYLSFRFVAFCKKRKETSVLLLIKIVLQFSATTVKERKKLTDRQQRITQKVSPSA